MQPNPTDPVFMSLSQLFEIGCVYRRTTAKLEVERLFALPANLGTFVTHVKGHFNVVKVGLQDDTFFDFDGCLSAIDAYFRIRIERSTSGEFSRAEIKAAYPGAASNANIRPVFDQSVDHVALARWQHLTASLGMMVERRYLKTRATCISIASYHGHSVELEVDEFQEGGPLKGHTFVSFLIEIADSQHQERAESALREAVEQVSKVCPLLDCGPANYEAIYYGRAVVPTN